MISDLNLLLISKDLFVYEFQLTSPISAMKVNSEFIGQKWPKLYQNGRFQKIKDRINNAYISQFKNKISVMFLADGQYGIRYYIEHNIVSDQFKYVSLENTILLSGWNYLHQFALIEDDDVMSLAVVVMTNTPNTTDTFHPKITDGPHLLCKDGERHLFLEKDKNNCFPVDLIDLKGFVFQNQFYLFGPKHVTMFSTNLYELKFRTLIQQLEYAQFFSCEPNFDKNLTSNSSTMGPTFVPNYNRFENLETLTAYISELFGVLMLLSVLFYVFIFLFYVVEKFKLAQNPNSTEKIPFTIL